MTEPATPPSTPASSNRPSLLPKGLDGWLILIGGAACIGYGVYSIVESLVGGYLLGNISILLVAIGGMIIPLRWVGLAAGVGLVGLAVYMVLTGYGMLSVLLVGVLGLICIAERWRRLKAI